MPIYSYVGNVNRIFGSDVPAGDHEQSTHLLNARVGLSEDWTVVGYAYLIDNDDAPAFSTDTFGVRLNGNVDLGGGKLAAFDSDDPVAHDDTTKVWVMLTAGF